jgi:hypothetical protein
MAMRCIANDAIVEIQDAGAVDGSPAADSYTVITTLCKRVNADESVDTIDVSGFESAIRLRPNKQRYRIELECLIDYVGGVMALTRGNYIKFRFKPVTGLTYAEYECGVLVGNTWSADNNSEQLQRLVIEGPADQ